MSLVFLPCEKELEGTLIGAKQSEVPQEIENAPAIDFSGQGTKLEIPYTVENTQKAYDNLAENKNVSIQGAAYRSMSMVFRKARLPAGQARDKNRGSKSMIVFFKDNYRGNG